MKIVSSAPGRRRRGLASIAGLLGVLLAGWALRLPAAESWCQTLPAPAAGVEATASLQQAIDRCSAAGGGRLQLSPGLYVTAPLTLRSGVDLVLPAGTVLRAIAGQEHYRAAYINWPYRPGEALLSIVDAQHVSLRGQGRIDGLGSQWWPQAQQARRQGNIQALAAGIPASNGLPRPWLIEIVHSRGVRIQGLQIDNAPMWNLVSRYSQDVRIEHVSIRNPADSPNTDGIDIVSSRHVLIRDSRISTGDDCIAIKSGLPGSRLPAVPSEDVRIEQLWLGRGHGLSVGSETLFGIRHVQVRDVVFDGTDAGVRIKSGRDRGNQISDLHFRHLRMYGVGTALSILAYYPHPGPVDDPAQPLTATTPWISDVSVSDLQALGSRRAGLLIGLPEAPLQGIRLSQLSIQASSGLLIRHAAVRLAQVRIQAASGPALQLQRGAHVQGQLRR